MRYDFETMPDRRGRDAIALDMVGKPGGFAPAGPREGFSLIPMWVADMNFPTAPSILQAVSERLQHPAFGYFMPREEYYDSIIRWQRARHGAEAVPGLDADCIGYENGVLGGLVSALNVFCSRGDHVLVHTPTYIGFTNTLRNNGYHIVHSPLIYRETDGGAGSWYMDFEDMERKIRDNRIHAAVFCSPHNPCGRVWTKEELEQAFAIFAKYDVKVVSDEIWSDLILSGHRHIPAQSVSDYARENTVALYAPSKTFNLAGFVGSYHIIYNKTLRERVLKEASLSHYNDMNVLSMYALIGAYSAEGEAWLEELRRVLTGNTRYAVDYIRSRFEGVTLAEPEGTYMLFPDCTGWCGAHKKTLQELEHLCWQTGVALQDGKMFNGQCHLRINLALPLTRVREAMERLDRYVFNAQERFDMVGKSVHFGCEISR